MMWLYIAFGGALGSVSRFWLTRFTVWRFGSSISATLTINIIGSFLLGFTLSIISISMNQGLSVQAANHSYAFFELGLLGGFTTFSTFIFELQRLLMLKPIRAFLYLVASLLLCVLSILLGYISAAGVYFA